MLAALIDNPLTKLEEDISGISYLLPSVFIFLSLNRMFLLYDADNPLADSNFSESAPSNDERPIPTAASKRTQVIPTSKVSPPPKKINVDPVNLQPEEQAIISIYLTLLRIFLIDKVIYNFDYLSSDSDSSDSDTDWNLSAPDDEQRPRHQSSEPTQEVNALIEC